MTIKIVHFILGPMENNSFLLADDQQKVAIVIDPSFESEIIIDRAKIEGWKIQEVWLTHAHFDHLAGVRIVSSNFQPHLPIGLHPYDFDLWKNKGGGSAFGFRIDPGPLPQIQFSDGQNLMVGRHIIEIRHTPGHTPGHVTFYAKDAAAAFCGDVIFAGSIGRTDLPGGSSDILLQSIRKKIFSLPPQTRLLCGHGSETTVKIEMDTNPFFQ